MPPPLACLPVRLSVVNHGEDAQDLDGSDAAAGHGPEPKLHRIQRVVVAPAPGVLLQVARVLPRLGQGPIIEQHVPPLVAPQLPLLLVLLQRVARLTGADLKLGARPLGDLKVEGDG